MRFKLTLKVNKHKYGSAIPLNYQYEQSAVVYRILSEANTEYTQWLHNNGYPLDGKHFKLFTYSRFIVPEYKINKEDARLIILTDTIEWYLSFLPEKSTETFIRGLFLNRVFQLGDKKSKVEFVIDQVELLPPLDFTSETVFETLSPICISKREEDGKTTYLSPNDPYSLQSIYSSLVNRYQAYYKKTYTGSDKIELEMLNEPKSVLIKIKAGTPKQTNVRGFMCKFKLNADPELLAIMYECGIGMKGSQGWGMVKVRE